MQGWSREEVFSEVQREARAAGSRQLPGADRLALISRHDIANIQKQLQLKPAREEKKREREATKRARAEEEQARVLAKEREKAAKRAQRLLSRAKETSAAVARRRPEPATPKPRATAEPSSSRQLRTTTRCKRQLFTPATSGKCQYYPFHFSGAQVKVRREHATNHGVGEFGTSHPAA